MRSAVLAISFFIVLVGATFWYGGQVNVPVLQPAGPIGFAERHILVETFLVSSIVVVPVFFLLFYFAWRFRDAHPKALVHHRPDWDHDSHLAEFAWWLVPILIVGFLSVLCIRSSYALDPWYTLHTGNALEVQVVALDWKWLFIYPEQGIATVNELVIPAGRPVHFDLSAEAPMNSFWVPQLGGQIMVMPGMSTQLSLEADRPGTFQGYSANISGEGFSGMAFTVKAMPESDFDAWADSVPKATSTVPLTLAAYHELAKPSEYDAPRTYAPVSDELYNTILMQYMMPSMNEPAASTTAPMDTPMDMNMPMQLSM